MPKALAPDISAGSTKHHPGTLTDLTLYRADLHIHTCLSPCGDWDMTPRAVVDTSCEKNIDIIAITDHNSAENADAAVRYGNASGLIVFPGMEICTSEEVHIIALFDTIDAAYSMQSYIFKHLSGENRPDLFGYQVIANEMDDVIDQNPRMLIGAVAKDLNDVVETIHKTGGLAIAAHIDKKAFSILGQLGFIPPDLPLDGVEVSFRERPETASETLLFGRKLPCITSSDAHFTDEIGRVTTKFLIAEPTLQEIRMALRGEEGRGLVYSRKR